ncbi:Triosephosphate isomerase - like 1 [Theobroma cacao]|nr:Triosephosphate isomerase - like 1 [Theobroma cacao]
MAMVSTYCPQFSGLRRSCPKLDNSQSQSFVQHINSQLRLSSSPKPCRAVLAMAGSGKFFVGGNWKCNGTNDSITKLVSDLNSATLESDVGNLLLFSFFDFVEQLKDIGCKWVILGHSERRHIIGEDDQFIGKKAAYALNEGLGVIACIGELLEEREAGKTFDVCFQQLKAFAGSVNGGNCADLAKEEDIDGFLVGGASLKGPEFATIINSVTSKKVAA